MRRVTEETARLSMYVLPPERSRTLEPRLAWITLDSTVRLDVVLTSKPALYEWSIAQPTTLEPAPAPV